MIVFLYQRKYSVLRFLIFTSKIPFNGVISNFFGQLECIMDKTGTCQADLLQPGLETANILHFKDV